VSKKVDSTYRSGPCRVWIKVRSPASIAVQRERSEIWNWRANERDFVVFCFAKPEDAEAFAARFADELFRAGR
jgi:ATP-dependent DNA ligase